MVLIVHTPAVFITDPWPASSVLSPPHPLLLDLQSSPSGAKVLDSMWHSIDSPAPGLQSSPSPVVQPELMLHR